MSAIAVTLRFHRTLYMLQAVREAARIYGEFAKFQISTDGDYYVANVSDPDPEVDGDIAREFANQALVGSIARRRHKAA